MAQALTDVEKMAELLRVPIEVRDRAGAGGVGTPDGRDERDA